MKSASWFCPPPKPAPDDVLIERLSIGVRLTDGRVYVADVVAVAGDTVTLRTWGCTEPIEIGLDQIASWRVVSAHSHAQASAVRHRQRGGEPADRVEPTPTLKTRKRKREARKPKAKTAKPAIARTADLDAAIAEYHRHAQTFATSAWDVGAVLVKIRDRDLWKLRLDDNGSPRFSTFESFIREELGCSHTAAAAMMRVARSFTREDVARIGVTKLALVDRGATDDERAELMAAAESGATTTELQAIARAQPNHRSKPGTRPAAKVSKEARRKRAVRRRELARAKAERGPTEREIAVEIVEAARPIIDFDRIVQLASVDLSDDQRTTIGDELAERLDRDVRRAVVSAVRSLRRATL